MPAIDSSPTMGFGLASLKKENDELKAIPGRIWPNDFTIFSPRRWLKALAPTPLNPASIDR